MKDDFFSYRRASRSSVTRHNRVTHFEKALDKVEVEWGKATNLLDDFEDFIRVYDKIEKGGRKNFVLSKCVLYGLLEKGGSNV